jgi:hypothetical protein
MKLAKYSFIIVVISLIFLEIFLRILGEWPLRVSNKIETTPGNLFKYNDKYGYLYAPGTKSVTLNGSLTYNLYVDSSGFRMKSNLKSDLDTQIAIFGCSFFGGMGVNDEEVLDFYLQNKLKNYKVQNFAIPGHGMNLQYLKLKDLIDSQNKPDYAIFEIASFHLIRNPAAFLFIKNFANIKAKPSYYLKSSLNGEEQLKFETVPVNENISFLDYYSATYHFLKKQYYSKQYSEEYLLKLQYALMKQCYELCVAHQIEPVFVVITKDQQTNYLLSYLKEYKYPYFESQVDYSNNTYNLNPYDQHPNAYAHEVYAEEIYNFINKDLTE